MTTITKRQDGQHEWVDVANDNGDHLFSHVTPEKAIALLERDHREDAAAAFADPGRAPKLDIRIVS
jgi:hypothetical protein